MGNIAVSSSAAANRRGSWRNSSLRWQCRQPIHPTLGANLCARLGHRKRTGRPTAPSSNGCSGTLKQTEGSAHRLLRHCPPLLSRFPCLAAEALGSRSSLLPERLLDLLLESLVSDLPIIQHLSKDECVGGRGKAEGEHDERVAGLGERGEDASQAAQEQQR